MRTEEQGGFFPRPFLPFFLSYVLLLLHASISCLVAALSLLSCFVVTFGGCCTILSNFNYCARHSVLFNRSLSQGWDAPFFPLLAWCESPYFVVTLWGVRVLDNWTSWFYRTFVEWWERLAATLDLNLTIWMGPSPWRGARKCSWYWSTYMRKGLLASLLIGVRSRKLINLEK